MPQPARVYKTPAIVLRQRKLGDTDKILTLYTASYGKLDAVAKGVRKTRSRLAGHVEPLTHATFLLAKGKSLDIVTQVETIESFQRLRDDLDRLSCAIYACELLDRLTEPRAEHFGLYRLLLDTLRRLASRPDVDTPLRYCEMSLLDLLGYRPELEECVACRGRLTSVTNYWSSSGGGVICSACGSDTHAQLPVSPNAVKLLRLLLHGGFADVARVTVDDLLGAELERTLRDYLRWILDRDPRSAAFMDALRRRRRAPRPEAADAAAPAR